MISSISRKYFLKAIRLAHFTHQCPLIWNEEKRKFMWDKSKSYRNGALVVLGVDTFAFLALIIGGVLNYSFGLRYAFTLVPVFLIGPTFENIIIDISTQHNANSVLVLMNSLISIVNSPPASCFHLPSELTCRYDGLLELIGVGGIISTTGLTLLFPLLFLNDLVMLIKAFIDFAQIGERFGVNLARVLEISGILTTLFVFGVNTQLTAIKWITQIMQTIPSVYAAVLYISPTESGFSTEIKIRNYQSIYILVNILNEVYSIIFITFQGVLTVVIATGFTLCFIDGVSVLTANLFLLSLVMLLFTNFILNFTKSIYESSNDFIFSCLEESHGIDKLALNKSVKSLRQCRINAGSQYFIDRGVLPQINNAIIENTIDNVLMFESF